MASQDETERYFVAAMPWKTYLDINTRKSIDLPLRRRIGGVWQYREATEAESEARAIRNAL